MSNTRIDVCLSPSLYPVYKDDSAIVVVIDVLRATSAICTAFEHGAEKIIPVATVEEAMNYKRSGFLAGAERDAIMVEGFDFGNSPFSYMSEQVKGKTIALTTTNGTQAIDAAKDAYQIVIGSFLNISALCDYLLKQDKNVLLLCSGWKNKFNLEDTLFAGAVVDRLSQHTQFQKTGDAALAAMYLFHSAKEDPYKFLSKASHKERLARLNLKEDIKYCLRLDLTSVVPVIKDGAIVISKSEKPALK